MEKKKPIYVKGFNVFAKSDKAPDWVLGRLVIDIDAFNEFALNGEAKEYLQDYKGHNQVSIDVHLTKDGKPCFVLNTYKAEKSQVPSQQVISQDEEAGELPF